MSGSNCCLLTCTQISQEASKVVWYFYLLKNFPHIVVIHTVKGFSVAEAEIDVFLEFPCFFYDPVVVDNLTSGYSAFSKSSLFIWKFSIHLLLKCCTQYASKYGKLSSGHRTRKGQFSFQSQRKAMPKNVQMLHNCTYFTCHQSKGQNPSK